jgi:hypothetical protein
VLTQEEKRFIKYWEEQRTGGKYKYYLLYIPAGTFISIIILSVFYCLIISQRWSLDTGLFIIMAISPVLMAALTIFAWDKNEKRFKSIIKREIREGEKQDGNSSSI